MYTHNDCDIILEGPTIDFRNYSGDAIVGIPAGVYDRFAFAHLQCNIEIVNLGLVEFTNTVKSHVMRNCKGVKLNFSNGMRLGCKSKSGLHIFDATDTEHTHDIEVCGLEIQTTPAASDMPMIKLTPTPAHRISNVHIHHNVVSSPLSHLRRGLYIGNPHWVHGDSGEIENVLIEHNSTFNTLDAIELKACVSGGIMRYNHAEFAHKREGSSQSAIGLMPGTMGAKVYGNRILYAGGVGIFVYSMTDAETEVYDNLIIGAGLSKYQYYTDGISIHDVAASVHHNTVMDSVGFAIRLDNRATQATAHNNVLHGYGTTKAVRQGGAPDENIYDNHTIPGDAQYVDILPRFEQQPPPPQCDNQDDVQDIASELDSLAGRLRGVCDL